MSMPQRLSRIRMLLPQGYIMLCITTLTLAKWQDNSCKHQAGNAILVERKSKVLDKIIQL